VIDRSTVAQTDEVRNRNARDVPVLKQALDLPVEASEGQVLSGAGNFSNLLSWWQRGGSLIVILVGVSGEVDSGYE